MHTKFTKWSSVTQAAKQAARGGLGTRLFTMHWLSVCVRWPRSQAPLLNLFHMEIFFKLSTRKAGEWSLEQGYVYVCAVFPVWAR